MSEETKKIADGSDRLDELVRRCESLRLELERQTQDYDDYGVPGSTFRICTYCGAETGAGLLDKGFQHDETCILYTPNNSHHPERRSKR